MNDRQTRHPRPARWRSSTRRWDHLIPFALVGFAGAALFAALWPTMSSSGQTWSFVGIVGLGLVCVIVGLIRRARQRRARGGVQDNDEVTAALRVAHGERLDGRE